MANVTMRYWAAAKEAAGASEEKVSAPTLAIALGIVRSKRGGDSRFATVLARSSFLIDSRPAGRRAAETIALPEGAVIEVLPPFAGG
jgi:molybdopterin converting factor small subunit